MSSATPPTHTHAQTTAMCSVLGRWTNLPTYALHASSYSSVYTSLFPYLCQRCEKKGGVLSSDGTPTGFPSPGTDDEASGSDAAEELS